MSVSPQGSQEFDLSSLNKLDNFDTDINGRAADIWTPDGEGATIKRTAYKGEECLEVRPWSREDNTYRIHRTGTDVSYSCDEPKYGETLGEILTEEHEHRDAAAEVEDTLQETYDDVMEGWEDTYEAAEEFIEASEWSRELLEDEDIQVTNVKMYRNGESESVGDIRIHYGDSGKDYGPSEVPQNVMEIETRDDDTGEISTPLVYGMGLKLLEGQDMKPQVNTGYGHKDKSHHRNGDRCNEAVREAVENLI